MIDSCEEVGTRDSEALERICGTRFSIDQIPNIWTVEARTEWVVDHLVPSGGLTLLTGDSGVGKSTLALALVGSVVHGSEFLGRETMQQRALYVDGENPVATVRERLDRLEIVQTSTLDVWGGWVETPPQPPYSPHVLEWAEKYKGIIVYDSLIQFHPGSEQDSSETRRYMTHFRTLANAGASVVILHHTGKGDNSKQYRGSSDIKAAVDQAFCLESIEEVEAGTRTMRLAPFKCRIAPVEALRLTFSGGVFQLDECTSKTNRETLEELIDRYPNRSGRELTQLATANGVSKNRVEALLQEGDNDGWLIVTLGPRNSKLYRVRGPDD